MTSTTAQMSARIHWSGAEVVATTNPTSSAVRTGVVAPRSRAGRGSRRDHFEAGTAERGTRPIHATTRGVQPFSSAIAY